MMITFLDLDLFILFIDGSSLKNKWINEKAEFFLFSPTEHAHTRRTLSQI